MKLIADCGSEVEIPPCFILEIDEKIYPQSAIRPIGILDIRLLFICKMASCMVTNV